MVLKFNSRRVYAYLRVNLIDELKTCSSLNMDFVSLSSYVLFGELSSSCGKFQLIFSSEYTKAMDQDWHTSHFACFQCDIALTGHRYVLRDDHAYCIHCYEKLFAHTCEECKTLIGTDSKVCM